MEQQKRKVKGINRKYNLSTKHTNSQSEEPNQRKTELFSRSTTSKTYEEITLFGLLALPVLHTSKRIGDC